MQRKFKYHNEFIQIETAFFVYVQKDFASL